MNLNGRLKRLEDAHSPPPRALRYVRVIGDEEEAAARAEHAASGDDRELFIIKRVIVEPAPRHDH